MPAGITRRDFLTAAAGAGLLACGVTDEAGGLGSARLSTRPHGPGQTITPGVYPLGRPDTDGYDGYLLVPASYQAAHPAPLVVSLHGAGGGPTGPIGSFGPVRRVARLHPDRPAVARRDLGCH